MSEHLQEDERQWDRAASTSLAHLTVEERSGLADPWRLVARALVSRLSASRAEAAKLRAEVARLDAWLEAIEGGDHPITDEAELRQMAYRARTPRKPAPEGVE